MALDSYGMLGGYEPQPKKQNWLQKLAQLHKDAEENRQVQAGQKRLEAWKQSQSKKGFGPQGPVGPDLATGANQPKTQTKPKPAAKKSKIPGWMQRKLDQEFSYYKALYGDRTVDKKGKSITKNQLKKNELKEMDDLVKFISKSTIPYVTDPDKLQYPYSEEELTVVQSKNVASKMQYDKALQRYNELADKYKRPRFGDKEVKEKNGNGENGDKQKVYDFSDPKLELTDDLIKNIIAGADSTQNAQLDSAMTAKQNALGNNQNIDKAGSDTSWIKKIVSNVLGDQFKGTRKKQEFIKTNPLWKKFTMEERNKFRKDGIVPDRFKDQVSQAK
jgi:hypothetical protein